MYSFGQLLEVCITIHSILISFMSKKNKTTVLPDLHLCASYTCFLTVPFYQTKEHTGIKCNFIQKPAIEAMHGSHSVSDFDHCTVIHCHAGEVSLVDQ